LARLRIQIGLTAIEAVINYPSTSISTMAYFKLGSEMAGLRWHIALTPMRTVFVFNSRTNLDSLVATAKHRLELRPPFHDTVIRPG
jgi:hypothetical protein